MHFLNILLLGRSEKARFIFISLSSALKSTDTKLLCFLTEAGFKSVYSES